MDTVSVRFTSSFFRVSADRTVRLALSVQHRDDAIEELGLAS